MVLERVPLSLVRINEEILEIKSSGLTAVGDAPRWQRDTPLSTKFGTKIGRPVSVA
jgi:hypothetical protein